MNTALSTAAAALDTTTSATTTFTANANANARRISARPARRTRAWLLATAAATLLLQAAPARGSGADRVLLPADAPAAYAQECASCHTPYPPGMLAAASWQRLMAGLDKHYGTDAALAPVTRAQIEAWLLRHAGRYKRTGSTPPPEDRITRSAWFLRKHDDVEAATWRLPSVKTPANCAACHPRADLGDFDDDRLRLPEGASASQRRTWHD